MKKRFALLTTLVLFYGFTTTINAALIDRGNGMIYDTDLNVTWLQDANLVKTTGFPSLGGTGRLNWLDALAWADALVFGGFDDWRLPTTGPRFPTDPNFPDDELSHLFIELGNSPGGPLTNTGPFINVEPDLYWTKDPRDFPGNPGAWSVSFNSGFIFRSTASSDLFVWAVRDGDILVPVTIDIKPGSDPNSINLCSNGTVPIAILGSDTFDVNNINTDTLRFAEASVKMVGKKDPHSLCSYEDVNGDGITDLVCHFVTTDIAGINGESTSATVNGELNDGTAFEGTDAVNIVKDTCN